MRELKISKSITNRDSVAIEKYLQEIGKIDLLSTEEEVELARKVQAGDTMALEKLVKANLRFVVSVAKQYQNNGIPLSDLINEGNLWLTKAAQKFDETRGFKFITYAVWRIRQSILQALADYGRMVRLPLNKIWSISKVNQASSSLEQKYEREPTPEEIAEMLEMPLDDVQDTIYINRWRHTSLDAPVGGDEDSTFSLNDTNLDPDTQAVKDDLFVAMANDSFNKSMQLIVNHVFAKKPQTKDILFRFFGIGQEHPEGLEDIGLRYNLTRERVRQIKDAWLARLKPILAQGNIEDVVEKLRQQSVLPIQKKKTQASIAHTFSMEKPPTKRVTPHTSKNNNDIGISSIPDSWPTTTSINNNNTAIHSIENESRTPSADAISIDEYMQIYAKDLQEIEFALQTMTKKPGKLALDYMYVIQCGFHIDSYILFWYLWKKYDDIHTLNTIDRNYLTMFISLHGKMPDIKNMYGQEEAHHVYRTIEKAFAVIDKGLKNSEDK